MRVVLQRVSSGSVSVCNHVISSIDHGLVLLVGLCSDDTAEDVEYMARKVLNARLFSNHQNPLQADHDPEKPWHCSVSQLSLEILSISQFTLFGSLKKGNKPDFHAAMSSALACDMYQSFLDRLKSGHPDPSKVKDGQFQAHMVVNLTNDGPVTLLIDSKQR